MVQLGLLTGGTGGSGVSTIRRRNLTSGGRGGGEGGGERKAQLVLPVAGRTTVL